MKYEVVNSHTVTMGNDQESTDLLIVEVDYEESGKIHKKIFEIPTYATNGEIEQKIIDYGNKLKNEDKLREINFKGTL